MYSRVFFLGWISPPDTLRSRLAPGWSYNLLSWWLNQPIAMENSPFWWYLPGKMRISWALLVSGRVVKLDHFPNCWGEHKKKYLSCHQLDRCILPDLGLKRMSKVNPIPRSFFSAFSRRDLLWHVHVMLHPSSSSSWASSWHTISFKIEYSNFVDL